MIFVRGFVFLFFCDTCFHAIAIKIAVAIQVSFFS